MTFITDFAQKFQTEFPSPGTLHSPAWHCPHCGTTLLSFVTEPSGTLRSMDYSPAPYEEGGDTIHLLEEERFTAYDRFDAFLKHGVCTPCLGYHFTLDLRLASRPVRNVDKVFMVVEPIRSSSVQVLGHADWPEWVLLRHVDARVYGDPDASALVIDEHQFGPFALPDSVGPDLSHEQDIWLHAAHLVSAVGPRLLSILEATI